MSKYPYPYIECDKHPGPQRGIALCKHIVDRGAPVHYSPPPSDAALGLARCEQCCRVDPDMKFTDVMTVICEGHYIELAPTYDDPRGVN